MARMLQPCNCKFGTFQVAKLGIRTVRSGQQAVAIEVFFDLNSITYRAIELAVSRIGGLKVAGKAKRGFLLVADHELDDEEQIIYKVLAVLQRMTGELDKLSLPGVKQPNNAPTEQLPPKQLRIGNSQFSGMSRHFRG